MTRHLIQGHFGSADRGNLAAAGADEKPTHFDLVAHDKFLNFGIGAALADLKAKNVFPSEIALDLLVTAAQVYAADTRISRATESDDAWTREIRVVVPVSDVARWNAAVPVLERMLNFLTGDRWTIQFRSRPARFAQIVPQANLIAPSFTGVSLFSGGLDSLIGAIDQLEAKRAPLLVSHAGEPAVSKAQEDCFEALKTHYPKLPFDRLRTWMTFPKKLVRNVGSEDSTRGRSFLFFALGVFAGTGLRHNFVLQAPENGLIALNVPLDTLRLGALSTRTTHPFYIARWNDLLNILGLPGRIENPYWDKTKGDMVPSMRQSRAPKADCSCHAVLRLADEGPLAGSWHAALRILPAMLDPPRFACVARRSHNLYRVQSPRAGVGSTNRDRRADSIISIRGESTACAARNRKTAHPQAGAAYR